MQAAFGHFAFSGKFCSGTEGIDHGKGNFLGDRQSNGQV
jgi:hypothetical protein